MQGLMTKWLRADCKGSREEQLPAKLRRLRRSTSGHSRRTEIATDSAERVWRRVEGLVVLAHSPVAL
eukprot:3283190-Amphidinium_carterae.1